MDHARALTLIKLAHTAVWAIFVACILGIFYCAATGRLTVAAALIAVVTGEVVVLACNGMRCPLTALAARHTDDRRDNFDIYLPLWIARYNKQVFGSLFVAGILVTLVAWLR